MTSQENRAVELAMAHWQFIRGLLHAHRIGEEEIETAQFHYLQAFRHGYKHAVEDMEAGRATNEA